MRTFAIIMILVCMSNATEILKWKGETLNLKVSVKGTSHLIFDEPIESVIYPKEENVNIIRNGKDIYFRYNPFIKYKVKKSGDKIQKIKDGLTYKGNRVKIWFVGKETGTSYAVNMIPGKTKEDTFYIRNETASASKKMKESMRGGRTLVITTLAKKAARGEPIDGYTIKKYSSTVKITNDYTVKLVKRYRGFVYDVDVYKVVAKKPVILDEFRFIGLPKRKKVFIGLVNGWKKPLRKGHSAKVVIVSER